MNSSNIEASILRDRIKKEIRRMLLEEVSSEDDLFSDTSSEEKKPEVAQDEKVSEPTKDEYTIDGVIQKLNTIRSGRSFKDDEIFAQIEKYYNDLKEPEKKALHAFLLGISQIVTAGVPGASAPEPSEPPTNVKMLDKKKIKSKEVKPNIIKKGGQTQPSKSIEDTSAPVNVKNKS